MENNLTTTTAEVLTEDLAALKNDVARIAADLKEQTGVHVHATRQLINEKVKSAREAAAARPLAILGVGFLLGFLLAIRLRR